jgi:DNA polymerase III sliding clamp (beta) subunit (PCNA family)
VLVGGRVGELSLVRRDERVAIPARYDGPDVHVALDPAFAADAVAAALGPDIVIEVGEALQPVVFRSADDGTFTTLLMPVRLT